MYWRKDSLNLTHPEFYENEGSWIRTCQVMARGGKALLHQGPGQSHESTSIQVSHGWQIVTVDSLWPCGMIYTWIAWLFLSSELSLYSWCHRDCTSHSEASSFGISASLFHFKAMLPRKSQCLVAMLKKPQHLTIKTVPSLHRQHLFPNITIIINKIGSSTVRLTIYSLLILLDCRWPHTTSTLQFWFAWCIIELKLFLQACQRRETCGAGCTAQLLQNPQLPGTLLLMPTPRDAERDWAWPVHGSCHSYTSFQALRRRICCWMCQEPMWLPRFVY